jgi:pyruvate dehydrogenase E2 component (dihydrolipoamide acetyltransferase)
MPKDFKLPDLGEGLTEAEIVQVLVSEGQEVAEDQAILLVETEKAQVELPSPFEGRVAKVHVRPGQRVKVGTVLLSFGDGQATAAALPGQAAVPGRGAAAGGPGRSAADAGAPAERAASPAAAAVAASGRAPAATPATRRLARELGVDLVGIAGTGPGGRITDADVREAAGRAQAGTAAQASPPPPGGRGGGVGGGGRSQIVAPAVSPGPLAVPAELPPLPRFEQWGPVEREALTGVRRRSAEHLARAWAAIPHVTQHDEADITALDGLRQRHRPRLAEAGGDLTLTVFLVKAVALVLQAHPRFNASLDPEAGELVRKRYYHIGVATDTERGLMVPVVRDADRKPLRELAVELARLVARTREGKATLEDLRGGSFTVTNTGALGGTGATPIVNYPEVAILGVGRARPMPRVRDGQIVPRLVLPLSLAFDHRVIDGMEAARFSTDLVQLLEDPERLLLDA